VLVDGVEHDLLRHLRACGIVEEYERGLPMKSRKTKGGLTRLGTWSADPQRE